MTQPYNYQLKGIRKITHFNGRALLADEMGLGKTLQSLLWADYNELQRVLVICPAFLKSNWQNEARQHIQRRALILSGRTPPEKLDLSRRKLVIINFDILISWVQVLRKYKPQLIIIDEGHYLANRNAKRSKAARAICRKVKNIIITTGTPLTNRPSELWHLLHILRPKLFPSFMDYAWRYCKPKKTPWGYQFRGAENLQELHSILLKTCMIRRRKRDVLKNLPDFSRHVIAVEIDRRSEYDKSLTDFKGWIVERVGKGKARGALRAEALTRIEYIKQLIAELKMRPVLEWIQDFLTESDDKLVVGGVHKKILKRIHTQFCDQAVLINGTTRPKDRRIREEAFKSDPKCRLLVGNMQSIGVGLNLVSAATGVTVELGWKPGEHSQLEKRIDRIGQKKKTTWYYLIARDTLEEKLCGIIQTKQKHLDAVLDGEETEDGIDLLDLLLKEIK